MTNTLTSDARATIDQIRRCEDAGADLIRVSCPDVESTTAFRQIARAAAKFTRRIIASTIALC
jgi:(E)-4-hydroxy-3-methylbut-2-enyl-diphosphate synthase